MSFEKIIKKNKSILPQIKTVFDAINPDSENNVTNNPDLKIKITKKELSRIVNYLVGSLDLLKSSKTNINQEYIDKIKDLIEEIKKYPDSDKARAGYSKRVLQLYKELEGIRIKNVVGKEIAKLGEILHNENNRFLSIDKDNINISDIKEMKNRLLKEVNHAEKWGEKYKQLLKEKSEENTSIKEQSVELENKIKELNDFIKKLEDENAVVINKNTQPNNNTQPVSPFFSNVSKAYNTLGQNINVSDRKNSIKTINSVFNDLKNCIDIKSLYPNLGKITKIESFVNASLSQAKTPVDVKFFVEAFVNKHIYGYDYNTFLKEREEYEQKVEVFLEEIRKQKIFDIKFVLHDDLTSEEKNILQECEVLFKSKVSEFNSYVDNIKKSLSDNKYLEMWKKMSDPTPQVGTTSTQSNASTVPPIASATTHVSSQGGATTSQNNVFVGPPAPESSPAIAVVDPDKKQSVENLNSVRRNMLSIKTRFYENYHKLKPFIQKGEVDDLRENPNFLALNNAIEDLSRLTVICNAIGFDESQILSITNTNKKEQEISKLKKEFDKNQTSLVKEISNFIEEAYKKVADLDMLLEKKNPESNLEECEKTFTSLVSALTALDGEVKEAKKDTDLGGGATKELKEIQKITFSDRYDRIKNKFKVLLTKIEDVKIDNDFKKSLINSIKLYIKDPDNVGGENSDNLIEKSKTVLFEKEPSKKTSEVKFADIKKNGDTGIKNLNTLKTEIGEAWIDPDDKEKKAKLEKFPKEKRGMFERGLNLSISNFKNTIIVLDKLKNDISKIFPDSTGENYRKDRIKFIEKYRDILSQINLYKKELESNIEAAKKEKEKLFKVNLEAKQAKIEKSEKELLEMLKSISEKHKEAKKYLFKVKESNAKGWFGKKLEQTFSSPHTWEDAESFNMIYQERNELMSEVLEKIEKHTKNVYSFGDDILASGVDKEKNKILTQNFAKMQKKLRQIKVKLYRQQSDNFWSTVRGFVINPKLAANILAHLFSEGFYKIQGAWEDLRYPVSEKQSKQAKEQLFNGIGKKVAVVSALATGGVLGMAGTGAVLYGFDAFRKRKEESNKEVESRASDKGAQALAA